MILGTAGHIDHGKTALVKALTGVDTDRLPEERRRGITIELGFAPLRLDGVGTVGVIDVPGHEAFVRTMVAGASSIDLALLVIAADEGVMPQTREHVAILELLGVRTGVVALTKRDLADDDWTALVEDDVRELLAGTALRDAPIVAVSSTTGSGLDELRSALGHMAAGVPARVADDLFRMPVDRAFTVRGTGTVVTGTIASGRIAPDATVRVFPGGHRARVRGVQSHGLPADHLRPGTRGAIALAGVDLEHVSRGAVLVDEGAWTPSRVLRADVSLLPDVSELRPRTRVRLHLGTSETGARVVAAGGPLRGTELRPVRLALDEEVVARAGDRFVLRATSPVSTIGGGVITDPFPSHRRPRPWPSPGAGTIERLHWLLRESGSEGLSLAALPVRLGIAPDSVSDIVIRAGRNRLVAGTVYDSDAVDALRGQLLGAVETHHRQHPLELGAPLQSVRAAVKGGSRLVEEVLRDLVEEDELSVGNGLVRRRSWRPRLDPAMERLSAELESFLLGAGTEPPSVSDLTARHGDAVLPLLRLLGRDRVVQVEADRFYHASVLETLVSRLRTTMEGGREYSPGELRDTLGLTRKYLIPFLEYCDRAGVTERRGAGRVLCRKST